MRPGMSWYAWCPRCLVGSISVVGSGRGRGMVTPVQPLRQDRFGRTPTDTQTGTDRILRMNHRPPIGNRQSEIGNGMAGHWTPASGQAVMRSASPATPRGAVGDKGSLPAAVTIVYYSRACSRACASLASFEPGYSFTTLRNWFSPSGLRFWAKYTSPSLYSAAGTLLPLG